MQIVDLKLDHYNFYSPATGGVILEETDVNENEPSLLGYWIDRFWQEPHINDPYLETKWLDYLSNYDELSKQKEFINEFRSLEDFFADISPCAFTVYLVVDMNYEKQ